MDYLIVALLVLVLIELQQLRKISGQLEDLKVRLFHVEKGVIETKEQVEVIPKQRDHD
ncbi:hypothetical protein HZF02_26620 [Pseudomonas yamanorum]|nr:hypothetical protein HZF02_26620 [Pseudomonas yamanorum]